MSVYEHSRFKIFNSAQHPFSHDFSNVSYNNNRIPGISYLTDAIDYMINIMIPNYQSTVADGAALAAVDTSSYIGGEYVIVTDDGDGKVAGYVWTKLDGSSSWVKRYDVDWSADNILSEFITKTQYMYVHKYGQDDRDGAGIFVGQHVYGGASTDTNLTFNANSYDDTGWIQFVNHLRPTTNGSVDLGDDSSPYRFRHLYMSGNLSDGTNVLTVANAKTAYDHVSNTSNPHSTSYDNLGNQIGILTVDGDGSGTVDLSSSGAKTLTLTVADDSHNHVWSNIDAADEAVDDRVSSLLQDGDDISWSYDDNANTLTPSLSRIAAPSANTILGVNDAGNAWSAVSGTIELTGEVTGSASYDDSTGGWSIAATLTHETYSITELSDVDTSSNLDVGDYLIWNGANWVPTHTDAKIAHDILDGLGDDDHTQYALLLGRSGGQSIIGGIDSGDDLTLESTSDGTKGNIFFSSVLAPTTNASYSGGWSGTDIGDSSHYIRDVYSKGEFKGLRVENLDSSPTPSGQNVGRLYFNTTDKSVYVDNGTSFSEIGNITDYKDETWSGAEATKTYDVSSITSSATEKGWQFVDNNANYERIYAKIEVLSGTSVKVTTNENLANQAYRLIMC